MPSRRIAGAARRLADQNTSRLATAVPLTQRRPLTVTATSPLTVDWRGGAKVVNGVNVAATVAIGDRVMCDIVQGQIVVDYVIG